MVMSSPFKQLSAFPGSGNIPIFIESLDGQNDETWWLIRMSLIGQSASVALISHSLLLHTVRDTLGSQNLLNNAEVIKSVRLYQVIRAVARGIL